MLQWLDPGRDFLTYRNAFQNGHLYFVLDSPHQYIIYYLGFDTLYLVSIFRYFVSTAGKLGVEGLLVFCYFRTSEIAQQRILWSLPVDVLTLAIRSPLMPHR